jgi:AmiR/NasT family two-component response regulator
MSEIDRARWREVLDIRTALEQATEYLIARRKCTPREAREWIQQEARAKKVCLDRVAKAILLGKKVPYSHDVPI